MSRSTQAEASGFCRLVVWVSTHPISERSVGGLQIQNTGTVEWAKYEGKEEKNYIELSEDQKKPKQSMPAHIARYLAYLWSEEQRICPQGDWVWKSKRPNLQSDRGTEMKTSIRIILLKKNPHYYLLNPD